MIPVFRFFGWLAKFGVWFVKLLPVGLVVLITFITLFDSLLLSLGEGDASIFFKELVITIFSADYQIKRQVDIGVETPDNFGMFNILKIISSILIIYFLTKFLGKALIGFTGSQAYSMAYIFGFGILAVLEMSVVAFTEHELVYPMQGIVSLVQNYEILFNFNLNPFSSLQDKYLPQYNASNTTNITNITNST
jgi:hypothetical protein